VLAVPFPPSAHRSPRTTGFACLSSLSLFRSPPPFFFFFFFFFQLPSGWSAYAEELDLETGYERGLNVITNTFCSTGQFLPNGTLLNLGGAWGPTYYSRILQPPGDPVRAALALLRRQHLRL